VIWNTVTVAKFQFAFSQTTALKMMQLFINDTHKIFLTVIKKASQI